MQHVDSCPPPLDGSLKLGLSLTHAAAAASPAEARIRRLILENPVVICSRAACCMGHVMKRLLSAIGVTPTVVELGEEEIAALPSSFTAGEGAAVVPVVFVGGSRVGGLERLVALHVRGRLVEMLEDIGVFES